MPRPRKNDPTHLIQPILAEFARRLGAAIERQTAQRIEQELLATLRGHTGGGREKPQKASKRSATLCYFPGCKNTAAPRFGMFCAALHKDLPKADKEKYRAARMAPKNGETKKRGSKKG